MISYPVRSVLTSINTKYNISEILCEDKVINYFEPKVSSFMALSNKEAIPHTDFLSDCLYFISEYSICEKIPDGMKIIVVDDYPEKHREKYEKMEYCAVVGSTEDAIGIVSDIHIVFLSLQKNINSLMLSIANFDPAQLIVNKLSQLFQLCVFVAAENSSPLFISSGSIISNEDYSDKTKKGTISKIVEDLKIRESILEQPGEHSPIKRIAEEDISYIAMPMILGDKIMGRLVVFGNSSRLSIRHISLAYIVSEQIKHLSNCFFENSQMSSQTTLRTLLATLLRNEPMNKDNLVASLHKNGLELIGEYRLVLLNYVGKNKPMPQPEILDVNIGKCVAIPYSNTVYAVLVFGDGVKDISLLKSKLGRSLIQHNWKIRAGLVFYDLLRLSDQWLLLSSLDISISPEIHDYYVEEHLGEIFGMAINYFVPSDILCHPAVLKLKMHDENMGTDFVRTILSYLFNNKSLSQSAKELFIHKNTLSYRLNAINELVKIEYDDPVERLHILLSCILCVQPE